MFILKHIVIFNQKVAGFLMLHGFVLKSIEKCKQKNSKRNVFIFNDSEELRKWITEYDKFMSNNWDYFIK